MDIGACKHALAKLVFEQTVDELNWEKNLWFCIVTVSMVEDKFLVWC